MLKPQTILEFCHAIARGTCVGAVLSIATAWYMGIGSSPFGLGWHFGDIGADAVAIGTGLSLIALAACWLISVENKHIPPAERRSAQIVVWLSCACLFVVVVGIFPAVQAARE